LCTTVNARLFLLQVPVALACSAPEARVLPELEALGLSERLAAVVTAEDVARGRPNPEAVLLAAQRLGRPPIRCVLIGELQTACLLARPPAACSVHLLR
jgi:beta-phosphoglucomutase-like phosphatase (HAD superfamily)